VDGSPDALLICDRAGIVRYWNVAAERVFGFRAAEAIGASMDLIIPERLRGRHWAGWETVMTTGVTRYGEGQLLAVPALHKEGRQISIEFSIQLLKDGDGSIEWVVAIIRDVTERFLREKDLRARVKAGACKLQSCPKKDSMASAAIVGSASERRVSDEADQRVATTGDVRRNHERSGHVACGDVGRTLLVRLRRPTGRL
jgi:PAS domain S-box-containing protein